jgi:hypothetical protein
MKVQADETLAIQSLGAIYQTQIQYQIDFPASGFSCSLSALGGNASARPPSAGSGPETSKKEVGEDLINPACYQPERPPFAGRIAPPVDTRGVR